MNKIFKMNLTERQYDYAIQLLKNIGYTDENVLINLLELYEKKYSRVEVTTSSNSIKNRRGQHIKSVNVYKRKTINYSIDILKRETEIRFEIDKTETKKTDFDKYVSATDLATFIFCNASYSISNSFLLTYLKNKANIENGTDLHNELRLFFKKKFFGFKEENVSHFTDEQIVFLNKIKSCKLLFKGHEDEKHFFINDEKKFIGQPDYIFLDPKNNIFVVEEKYHFVKINETIKYSNDIKFKEKDFYTNHIIQLQSYIDYIKEYDIKYGVLINWYYYINSNFDKNNIIVYDFTFKIIWKNQNSELLEKTLDDVINFRNVKSIKFDSNVNFNKCLNCSVGYYCSHKTKNKTILELPYNK